MGRYLGSGLPWFLRAAGLWAQGHWEARKPPSTITPALSSSCGNIANPSQTLLDICLRQAGISLALSSLLTCRRKRCRRRDRIHTLYFCLG